MNQNLLKVLTIIGARPQMIKASMVSKEISKKSDIHEVIVHTGQHFDRNMSDIFFEEMRIPEPKYNLGVGGGTHGQNTGRMIEKSEDVLIKETPDIVLVYGDTNSTLAGALAAVKLHIPIAHIESGLRSYNKLMPEEINRILTDNISDFLFTPTIEAKNNLQKEGIDDKKIFNVGDVMYDATLNFTRIAEKGSKILDELNIKSKEYILATIHRQENTDNQSRLSIIFKTLNASKKKIVLPLHPRTKKMISRFRIPINENVKLIEPIGYLDMLMIQKNANLIITDSGGVQKEAYFHKVPCITLRDETEWVELVNIGCNKLISPVNLNVDTLSLFNDFEFPRIKNLYGNGNTSEKILNTITKTA